MHLFQGRKHKAKHRAPASYSGRRLSEAVLNFGPCLRKLPSQRGVTTALEDSTAWMSPDLISWCVSERGNQNQRILSCPGRDQACLAGAMDKAKIIASTLSTRSANLQGMKGNYLCIATTRLRQHHNTAGVCCTLTAEQSCLRLQPNPDIQSCLCDHPQPLSRTARNCCKKPLLHRDQERES